MKLEVGQKLYNLLSNGFIIEVRVMALNVAGTDMPRVCHFNADRPDQELIDADLTWAANVDRLFHSFDAALASHYDVMAGGA